MDLLDLFKELDIKCAQLDELFQDNQFLSPILEKVQDMILDGYGMPQDNTTDWTMEETQVFGDTNRWPDNYFCRDAWIDVLYKFAEGEISKEETINQLENWNK